MLGLNNINLRLFELEGGLWYARKLKSRIVNLPISHELRGILVMLERRFWEHDWISVGRYFTTYQEHVVTTINPM